MNETEKYIAEQIRIRVWSGFANKPDVQDMVTDILEDDVDEKMVRAIVIEEFRRKASVEKEWPKRTDCDRLDHAFKALKARGIIAEHNAGFDSSEGFQHCLDVFRQSKKSEQIIGLCFYHQQDVDNAVDGDGLYLGFSSTRADEEEKVGPEVGRIICEELDKHVLTTEWDGTMKTRIWVKMNWQRRYRKSS